MIPSRCEPFTVFLFLCIFGCFTAQTKSKKFIQPRSGFFSDIDGVSVAPGLGHICVLELKHGTEIGGRARCWGDEDESGKTSPPTDETFVQLASGVSFTCGLTITQTVRCWGLIKRGENVPGLYIQITASEHYACGVKTDGTLHCWGHSHVMTHTPLPQSAHNDSLVRSGEDIKYVQVSCSAHHCCALDVNAHAHCWGVGDAFGEMHPPSKRNITAVGIVSAAVELDHDGHFVEDEIKMGHDDESGDDEEDDENEGDETERDIEEKRKVLKQEEEEEKLLEHLQFKQLSVGDAFSCAIVLQEEGQGEEKVEDEVVQDGDLVCWGGDKHHNKMPHHVIGPYKQVSVGLFGVCAIKAARKIDKNIEENIVDWVPNTMQCWGFIRNLVSPGNALWDQVCVGSLSVCAVSMQSELKCWGTGLNDVRNMPLGIQIA